MPCRNGVRRARWAALVVFAPSLCAPLLVATSGACAQFLEGDCAVRPEGNVVGMVQAATPLLREVGCARAVDRTQLTSELSDVDRLRLMDDRRSPQTMTSRSGLVSSVLGSRDGAGEQLELAETLSNVMAVTLLGWQLFSDVSLHDRVGLPDSFGWEVLVADALAHGFAQGVAYAVREGAGDDCAPGDQACAGTLRPSNRAAMAFTSAGLMCVHRQMAGGVDMGHCLGGLALAAAVGAMRTMTEEHDIADVLVSAGIGLASGYLVPMAALYAFGARLPSTRESSAHEHGTADDHRTDWGVRATLAPSFSTSRGVGLRVQGTF